MRASERVGKVPHVADGPEYEYAGLNHVCAWLGLSHAELADLAGIGFNLKDHEHPYQRRVYSRTSVRAWLADNRHLIPEAQQRARERYAAAEEKRRARDAKNKRRAAERAERLKRGVPEGRVHIPLKLRFDVLERCGFKCAYCGRPSHQVALEVDHVVPIADGGTSDPSNLVAACWECNLGKRDRRLDP